jgi:formylmethanofuran dehydrogenase subunit E
LEKTGFYRQTGEEKEEDGMLDARDFLEMGLAFHGHKCPAMPLGLRAAVAAMNALGVERARDKELHVVSETGKGHAASCFLDGVMVVTGCTYGKSNVEKRYYNKMALTLVDVPAQRAVRVSLKPEFFTGMLKSPFVEQRKAGIPPQKISPAVADPLVEKVLSMPEATFLDIGPVQPYTLERKPGVFDAKACVRCGELTFVDKLVDEAVGLVCLGCREAEEKTA